MVNDEDAPRRKAERSATSGARPVADEQAPRRTQAERSATTRARLIDAAASTFAEKGFAEAGREEIVAAAGVTRGAMYHHFADKADLFRAVYETVEEQVMAQVATAAMTVEDPVERLRQGCRAYLDIALDPRVRRICIIDAPAVLDPVVRREVAATRAFGLVRQAIAEAVATGGLADQPVEALAHTLLAAVMAAAEYVAAGPDPGRARAEAGRAIDNLLTGLMRHGPPGGAGAP